MHSPEIISAEPKVVRPGLVLVICCLSMLIVGMDVTIVNVALPAMQHDLHSGLSGLQWIVDAYTLVIASLLMLSGSMADRFGRRRVFQIGLVLFLVGSLLCSLAHSIGQLIAFRAIQGLGASMLNPVALSIVANTFREPKARAKAIGAFAAVAGLSFALGPLLGGALTQTVGWRSVFWINLPIGLAAVTLAALFVSESKAPQARTFDPVGQSLVFIGLASLIYAVIEGPRTGWGSPLIASLFSVVGATLVIFLLYEPRRKQPFLDLRFFRSVPFSTAVALAVCAYGCFAGFLFLNALYLEQAKGFTPLSTGLCNLPLAIMVICFAPLSGHMLGRHGTRPSILAAGLGLLFSTLLLTELSVKTSLPLLLLSYALFGFSFGMINPAITNSAVTGMPLSRAGVAAAIASTSRQVGAALGVAIAGTVVNASRAKGMNLPQATHAVWWVMAACGAAFLVLGYLANTQ